VTPPRQARLRQLIEQSLSLPPEEREAFLAGAGEDSVAGKTHSEGLVVAPTLPPVETRIGQRIGPYRVIEKLGEGGMGVVYQARDERLGRLVALKFLPAPLTSDEVSNARFVKEARAASALDHPNICTIYEIGDAADGSRYIAMAHYPGQTLKALMEPGPMAPDPAVALAIQMAEGLARAHEAGIIHRDIKPANVMVTDRGLVKILDFGLAKLSSDTDASETGALMGTMAYMSPEQMNGESTVDHRSDIWALGLVLYEMLSGRSPYSAPHEMALLYAVITSEPLPLQQARAGIPDSLTRAVMKCLAKDPMVRYQEVGEFLADLRAFASRPEGLSGRLWPTGHPADQAATAPPPSSTAAAAALSLAALPPAEARDRANQLILLQKVRQFWIEGVLEQSIHRQAPIEVARETRPDAVTHPWQQILELPDQAGRPLAADQGIGDLFQEVGRSLLILGAPGSGKTITLLDLARELVRQAERDPAHSIPVVLNLSSWNPRQTLDDWIFEELSSKYQIPKRMGRSWLEASRLTLLLDGLDEVRFEDRAACVLAINAFIEEIGGPGIVVASRIEDYTALPVRLKLYAAIALRPLSEEQVQRHVERAGPALSGLATALRSNASLLSMAQSPLMLDVMTMACQEMSAASLTRLSEENWQAQRERLFSTYVDRMFQRRGQAMQAFSREETVGCLTWLARGMQRQGQTVFMLDQLQPAWLASRAERWRYAMTTRWVAALAVAIGYGLASGFVVFLLEMFRSNPDGTVRMGPIVSTFFGTGPRLGLVAAPLSGVAFAVGAGLFLGVIDGRRLDRGATTDASPPPRTLGRTFRHAVLVALGCAVAGGIGVGLFWGPLEGLEVGLFFGIMFAVIWGTRNHGTTPVHDIHPVEALTWSKQKALRGGVVGTLLGLVLGMALGVLFDLVRDQPPRLREILSIGAVWALAYSVLGVAFGGLQGDLVQGKTLPNQGIALSRKHALLMWLGFSVLTLLCQLVATWPFEGLFAGLIVGLLLGGTLGITAGMWYGGLDVLHHYALRFMLYRQGHMPLRYGRFLNYAHRLIFLQKVGGGVIFIHRLLLEYFASRPDARSER